MLISATLPHEILEMTNKFMTDPVRILVKRDELTLEVIVFFHLLSFLLKQMLTMNAIFLPSLICYHRASNNFLLLLREKNGNLILSVICMIRLPSPKL